MNTNTRAALLIVLAIISLCAANGFANSASTGTDNPALTDISDRTQESATSSDLDPPTSKDVPMNNVCIGAYQVPLGQWQNMFYNTDATDGPDVPGLGDMQKDIWFYCECGVDGPMIYVDLSGSSFDTRVAVYAGNPFCSGKTLLGYNDDHCSPQSSVMVISPFGDMEDHRYYIQVAGTNGASGMVRIRIECGYFDCFADMNDDCSTLASGQCSGYEAGIPVLSGHNQVEFTRSGFSACSDEYGCEQIGPAVWEAFEITEDMAVDLSFCGSYDVYDTLFTFLALNCPCGTGDPLSSENFVPCSRVNWSSCGDGNAVLTWDSLPPGVYYYPIPWDECRAVAAYTLTIKSRNKCCVFTRGDMDDDLWTLSLGDLTRMIDYLFISFTPPDCWEEANIDGSQPEGPGSVSLGDLTVLIAYLFWLLSPPPPCPY